jgi:hypothetical protein
MNARLIILPLAVLLVTAAAPGPAPQDQRAIRSFLVHVYTSYKECRADPKPCPKSVPWTAIFTRSTMALINRNLTLNGDEIGVAGDYDPICQCQDNDDIKVQAIELSSRSDGRILARVRFHNIGPQHVALVMEKESTGWRVYDVIAPPDQPSYRQALIADNQSVLRSRHHK